MTKTLERAVNAAASLPVGQQKQVAAFLMEEVMRAEMVAKLERAEKDIAAGRVFTPVQAKERLKKWLK